MWQRLKLMPIAAVITGITAVALGFGGVDSDAVIAVGLLGVTLGAISRDDT
jgi:hypothetical protein